MFLYKLIIASFVLMSVLHAQYGTLKPTFEFVGINGDSVAFQNGIPLPSFEKGSRPMQDLSGTWKKFRFTADNDLSLSERSGSVIQELESDGFHQIGYDDSPWEDKSIPGVENALYAFPAVPEYYESGVWYRYKFIKPLGMEGKTALLKFYAVNYIADVWLNGNYIGYHEGGYTPFAFDVTDEILNDSVNVIAVRVDNIGWGKRKDIVPFYRCDWFNYAGIIHDVFLEYYDPLYISRADIVPLDTAGNLKLDVIIRNSNKLISQDYSLEYDIYKADLTGDNINSEYVHNITGEYVTGGVLRGGSLAAEQIVKQSRNLVLPSPELWFPSDPKLYIIKITLKSDDNITDVFYNQFGIRKVETAGDKLVLNGKYVFLPGVARHEDHPDYGRSLPNDVIFSDLQKIKESNSLFLRTGHYPNHPYTYLIADRLGLAVMEEIPVWWFDNELEWQIQEQRRIHYQMFREMVFKDFNRASILFWSTSNECKETTNRLKYNQNIVNDLRTNYNDYRLISQSSAGDNPGASDSTQSVLDVPGWTMYFGIFHGSTYYAGTLQFLIKVHTYFPNKPILDTEFGYWSSENGSNLSKQVTVFTETFNAFRFFNPMREDGGFNSNGFVCGTTWWCMFDWYSHQHPGGYQSMGLISMDRATQKPVYTSLFNQYQKYADFGGVITGFESVSEDNQPVDYVLYPNFPNPFNSETNIRIELKDSSPVSIGVYNTLGEQVLQVGESAYSAGIHDLRIDLGNLPTGVYFLKAKIEGEDTRGFKVLKLLYIK